MLYQNEPIARSPLHSLIAQGGELQEALARNAQQFELAIEQRALALQHKLNAQETYDQAEAEFLADLAFSPDPDSEYSRSKNAEGRKLAADRALIRARTTGPLAQAWRALNSAKGIYDEADVAMQQMELRWKATRTACELHTQMLHAAK